MNITDYLNMNDTATAADVISQELNPEREGKLLFEEEELASIQLQILQLSGIGHVKACL